MICLKRYYLLVVSIFTVALLAFASGSAIAQGFLFSPSAMPGGDPIIGEIDLDPFGDDCISVTSHGLYVEVDDNQYISHFEEVWKTSGDISDAWIKKTTLLSLTIIVLTSDQTAHEITFGLDGKITKETTLPTTPTVGGEQPGVIVIGGDDIYLSTTKGMFVTHDNVTWEADSTGLGSLTGDALTLDSSLNVYIGTSAGIFQQAPGESVWHPIQGSPAYVQYLFTTPKNVIYGAINSPMGSYLLMSTDRGVSWHADSTGMNDAYTFTRQLAIDTAGNLYAITVNYALGDHVWMQTPGGAWHLIDQGLPAGVVGNTTLHVLKSIAADSALHLGTDFGDFDSRDHGATWHPVTRGLSASNVYAFYKFASGSMVMTTSLGLFTRGATDTTWSMRFPQNGYLSQIPVFADNAQRLYALGASRIVNYNSTPQAIYISSDEGVTWQPDTAGLSVFGSGSEFIDETGTEHLATSSPDHPKLLVKLPNGVWQGDSSGYVPRQGDAAYVSSAASGFATDYHGYIYLAINNYTNGGRLLRRPVSGGAWSELSTSALGGLPYVFTATKDGKLIAGGTTTMGYYDGSSWTVIPNPSGLNNPTGFPESVDSSGRLWAIFGNIDQNYYYTPYGVYWTSDLGQHWTQAADGTNNFTSLVSFGDTTYGLNSGNGLWYFVAGGADVAVSGNSRIGFTIMPNPSNREVAFDITGGAKVRAEVYDLLGSLVTTLNGTSNLVWNGSDASESPVPNGAYIVRVSGTDLNGQPFVTSKEMVIQR